MVSVALYTGRRGESASWTDFIYDYVLHKYGVYGSKVVSTEWISHGHTVHGVCEREGKKMCMSSPLCTS